MKKAKPKTTLIKNGTTVIGRSVSRQDVLISGEKIAAIGSFSVLPDPDCVIDANGLLVLPGAIDTHVHFSDDVTDTIHVHNFYTGTVAAAYGGVTTVVDFAEQASGQALIDSIIAKKEQAREQAVVDWGLHAAITQPTPDTLAQIPLVVEQGVPTIKCYMTYRKRGLMIGLNELKDIMKKLTEADGMLLLHAEDNEMLEENIPKLIKAGLTSPIYHAISRPPEVEEKAISQALRLVREVGGKLFIVHLASDKGMELIAQARAVGLDVTAETCTQYLIFTDELLKRDDGIKWICSPALRSQAIQNNLWRGVRDGRIAMISTDDAAFSWEAKLAGKDRFDQCPNGIPGVEPRLSILHSEGVVKGRISLPRLVELVAGKPAEIFGLASRKGHLLPGFDADIVLIDPKQKWLMNQNTLHMAADWSAYENIEITGKIQKVFSRGELIIDGEKCLATKGRGKYVHRRLLIN